MEPLDLRNHPPRSSREELDGLIMLPRTIDKFRAMLPGGDMGMYIINSTRTTGLSGFMLKRLGVSEEAFLEAVATAKSDEEVAAWLRANTDPSRYEKLSMMLANIEASHSEDPAFVREFYAETTREHPELTKMVDIIDADDRRTFGA
jgi:hypothetical protein